MFTYKPKRTYLLFREHVSQAHVREPSISQWSVGMHVHHCCLAMKGIGRTIIASRPPFPRPQFSFLKILVFLTGKIPRGRSQAPKMVLPKAQVSEAELTTLFTEVGELMEALPNLSPGQCFKHHVFGVLNRDQSLRFINIHNRHHLQIIADILAQQSGTHSSFC